MSDQGKLFDQGRLVLWSLSLEGLLFDKLGRSAWLNTLGTDLLSRHMRGQYGERTTQQKQENAIAIKRKSGHVISRHSLGTTFYLVTLFPLPQEPAVERTYLVARPDWPEFKRQILDGRTDGKAELKRIEKERAAKRKASRERAKEMQAEVIEHVEPIKTY